MNKYPNAKKVLLIKLLLTPMVSNKVSLVNGWLLNKLKLFHTAYTETTGSNNVD